MFDPDLSTSNKVVTCENGGCGMEASDCTAENQCQLTVRYTEGSSWTAYEHIDTLWLGTATDDNDTIQSSHKQYAAPINYGCQFYESGLFRTQHEDGILGLAMNHQMITSTFKQHGSILHNSFSICLDHSHKDEKGYLTLGGIKSSKQMMFTNMKSNPNGWYVIQITSVLVGDVALGTSNILRDTKKSLLNSFNTDRGTIIDSGTTDIYLPLAIAPTFIRVWESHTKLPFTNEPIELTYQQYKSIPNITLVLNGGYHWILQPKYYLEPMAETPWEGRKTFVNRVYLTEPNGAVLGVGAMLGREIYFDVEGKRIGFADSDCGL